MRWAMMLAVLLLVPGQAESGGMRLFGSTQVQYVQLRELDQVTVDADDLEGEGSVRRLPDGRWVTCDPETDTCTYFVTGDGIYAAPVVFDLRGSGWGSKGIRVYAHVRARQALGPDQSVWPLYQEELDLLSGYVEWSRADLRLRGGRQFLYSGLGVFNFDGASARVQPRSWIAVEGYGGWSLIRGVNRGRDSDLLSSVEEFAPNDRAYMLGGAVTLRNGRQGRLRLEYNREIFTDSDGLVGERIAGDLSYEKRGLQWLTSVEHDLSTSEWNELSVRLRLPRWRGVGFHVDAQHHHPYFEQWTIWNAFSPVGFDEIGGGAAWTSSDLPLRLSVRGASRRYEDTDAEVQFAPVRDDGWNLTADGWWQVKPQWDLQAVYRADFGPGETRSEGDLRVGYDSESNWNLGLTLQAIEFVREYRVAGSKIFGAGIDAAYEVSPTSRLTVGWNYYRHNEDERVGSLDFGQSRGFIRFDFALGEDPGMGRTP